jgi:hypothetical protein
MPNGNGGKRPAKSKRGPAKPEDRELGLWIDYDLLRRHRRPTPQTILHNPSPSMNNRYLELADLALGNAKTKRKSKSAASSE